MSHPEAARLLATLLTKIERWCSGNERIVGSVRSGMASLPAPVRADAEAELGHAEAALHVIERDLLVQMRAPGFPNLTPAGQHALAAEVENKEAVVRRHISAASTIVYNEEQRAAHFGIKVAELAIQADLVVLAVLPEIARYAVLIETGNKLQADGAANSIKVLERGVSATAGGYLHVSQAELDKGYGGSTLDAVIDGLADVVTDVAAAAKIPAKAMREEFKSAFETFVVKPVTAAIAAAAKDTGGTLHHRTEEARKAAAKAFLDGLDDVFKHLKVPIRAEQFKRYAEPVVAFLLEASKGVVEGKSPVEAGKEALHVHTVKATGEAIGHKGATATHGGTPGHHPAPHAGASGLAPKVKLTQAHHDWNRVALGLDTAARMNAHKPAAV